MDIKYWVILFVLLVPSVYATGHYSYEHAEELKPLIAWRDYSPAAFQESLDENKPIFLLLTAPSWCYWCQVYESEDYLFNQNLYPYINENFIPIYVDADKRQDITRQYLEGGWPSTTIFTPGRERLYGFSGPRPVANMLANLGQAVEFVSGRGFAANIAYDYKEEPVVVPTESQLNSLVAQYAQSIFYSYDSEHGGFGRGQKFPQGRALDYSLDLYELTGDKQWLELVQNTLQNQYTEIDELETNYNLFDPVEGGFHRYGTTREWTPPHYEKMLYDNARLLKAYGHLLKLTPEDELVKEVMKKTLAYVEDNWYDAEEGGFFGNTDVHGEDEYYGKNPRPADRPRVEPTKYTDWNSDAIVTYLYLGGRFKKMAEKSLDFYENMLSEQGAYHYTIEGKKGVRGNLLDNAYLLLAFVEGYESLEKEEYLESAADLADYSLANLYDWNSGGFFERNSPDKQLYAPGDHLRLSKPGPENGIMAYALLKLYKQTGNDTYLAAGIKTMGNKINQVGALDRGYHYARAAQFILREGLLAKFAALDLSALEPEGFWAEELVQDEFVVSEEGLEKLQGPVILLAIIALIAGFVSFISPCTLPILPAYVAYIFGSSKKSIKGMTIAFFAGLAILFTLLGMSATVVGGFLKAHLTIFSQIAGALVMLFGVYILLGKGFAGFKIKQKQPTTYIGSFFFGASMGVSWTPCVGPILVSILLLASTTDSALTGGSLLFFYAVGLALPLVLVSTLLQHSKKSWKVLQGKKLKFDIAGWKFSIHTNTLISGLLFIILGYLIFSGILFSFNQYVSATSFQKWIFRLEEWVLNLVR